MAAIRQQVSEFSRQELMKDVTDEVAGNLTVATNLPADAGKQFVAVPRRGFIQEKGVYHGKCS